MDTADQLYHLQLEHRKRAEQFQRETTVGFDFLRKRAEQSARRADQSMATGGQPQSARTAGRGWGASTREFKGSVEQDEGQSALDAIPEWLPADLRNILIRNQQMDLRWQREFAERLRDAAHSQDSRH